MNLHFIMNKLCVHNMIYIYIDNNFIKEMKVFPIVNEHILINKLKKYLK